MAVKGGTGKQAGDVAKDATEDLRALLTSEGADSLAASMGEVVAREWGDQNLSFDTEDIGDQMILSLSELLPDANGDVVLFSDSGPMAVAITTDERITDAGTADHYVTSTGVDVSGYHFYTFEAGLTIYYPDDIDLLVTAESM